MANLLKHEVRKIRDIWYVYLFSFFLFVFLLPNGLEYMADQREKNSAPEEWFEYYFPFVTPAQGQFYKGDILRFTSFIHYKKDLQIMWEDRIYCDNGMTVDTLAVQRSDWLYKKAGETVNLDSALRPLEQVEQHTSWPYRAEEIPSHADKCYLYAKAIAETPRGHLKIWVGRSEWFDVNK